MAEWAQHCPNEPMDDIIYSWMTMSIIQRISFSSFCSFPLKSLWHCSVNLRICIRICFSVSCMLLWCRTSTHGKVPACISVYEYHSCMQLEHLFSYAADCYNLWERAAVCCLFNRADMSRAQHTRARWPKLRWPDHQFALAFVSCFRWALWLKQHNCDFFKGS